MTYDIFIHKMDGSIDTYVSELENVTWLMNELTDLTDHIFTHPNEYEDIVDVEGIRNLDEYEYESVWKWSDEDNFPSSIKQRVNGS